VKTFTGIELTENLYNLDGSIGIKRGAMGKLLYKTLSNQWQYYVEFPDGLKAFLSINQIREIPLLLED
jgi:hypothetical protein